MVSSITMSSDPFQFNRNLQQKRDPKYEWVAPKRGQKQETDWEKIGENIPTFSLAFLTRPRPLGTCLWLRTGSFSPIFFFS